MCFQSPRTKWRVKAPGTPCPSGSSRRPARPLSADRAQRTAIRRGVMFQPALTRAAGSVIKILKNVCTPGLLGALSTTSVPPQETCKHTSLPASERGKARWYDPKVPHLTTSGSPSTLWAAYPHSHPRFCTGCYGFGVSPSHQHPRGPRHTLFSPPFLLIPLAITL